MSTAIISQSGRVALPVQMSKCLDDTRNARASVCSQPRNKNADSCGLLVNLHRSPSYKITLIDDVLS